MLSRLMTMLVLFAIVTGGIPKAYAEVVRVAVASNFLLPMKVLAKEYEKQTGIRLRISSGSTGKLFAQIINGAPFDVFFAANSSEPQRLEKMGVGEPGSRSTYALGRLALWSQRAELPGKDPLKTLQNADFKHLVIANPLTAPYGAAAVSTLKQLNLDKTLKPKLLTAENISQTYQYIATGNVDLGFVAWSQLLARGQEKGAWLVPEEYHPAIEQQLVLLKRSVNNQSARDFIAYMKSMPARKLIRSFGYGLGTS